MPDGRPVIVVADAIDRSAIDRLRAAACTVVDATSGAAALEAALPDAWGLIVRSRTQVTAALLARAPKLAVIGRAGVGVDNIDVAAASARRIRVVNAPTAATTSVAELTVALYLLLVRELLGPIGATRAGQWKRGTQGHELMGRVVGFVGYGRIAREVAQRVRPFGVRTIAFDPFVTATTDGTALFPLEQLLAEADIVSLHAALTPENHHLLDAGRIAAMKKGSYVVNVARGALVDESALLAAIRSGHLAGAALDVYEVEPPTRKELLEDPRIVPTPHLGASTHEAQLRAGSDTVDELLRALAREPLKYLVNPEGARTA